MEKINLKDQKGAATAIVIFTVIIFMTILIGAYGIITSKAKAQLKSDQYIQDIYGKEVERADRIYNELINKTNDTDLPTVTITMQNSEDYLFAIKSVVTVSDNIGIDYSQCKYIYTDSNTLLGDDITLYNEGSITEETTTIEKVKGAGTYYLHVLATDINGNVKEEVSSTYVTIASEANFDYTGAVRSTALLPGKYKLEVWGAEGGYGYTSSSSYPSGKGGYAKGEIELETASDIYVYAGGRGNNGTSTSSVKNGGFNGGGNSGYRCGGSGGGASDVRIGSDSLYSRVIVSGGGGRRSIL